MRRRPAGGPFCPCPPATPTGWRLRGSTSTSSFLALLSFPMAYLFLCSQVEKAKPCYWWYELACGSAAGSGTALRPSGGATHRVTWGWTPSQSDCTAGTYAYISLYVHVCAHSCSIVLTIAFHKPEIPFSQSSYSMQILGLLVGSSAEAQMGRLVQSSCACQHRMMDLLETAHWTGAVVSQSRFSYPGCSPHRLTFLQQSKSD